MDKDKVGAARTAFDQFVKGRKKGLEGKLSKEKIELLFHAVKAYSSIRQLGEMAARQPELKTALVASILVEEAIEGMFVTAASALSDIPQEAEVTPAQKEKLTALSELIFAEFEACFAEVKRSAKELSQAREADARKVILPGSFRRPH